MKPPRSKKGKSGVDKPAASGGETAGMQGESQAASAASKPKRGDRGRKRTQPPIRIVTELAPERSIRSTGEQAKETEAADRQDAELPWDPRERIAQRAYTLYEAGGYEQGKEVEHWLEAERQLEAEARGRNS
jgi:hypothetical protein